jgi:hypothetical protein
MPNHSGLRGRRFGMWEVTYVAACLTKLGHKGWESVTVVHDSPTAESMYFKRHLE